MKVTEIAYTAYPVTDMVRAREFYEKVLGLTASSVFEHGDRSWVEYEIGSGALVLSNMAPDWKPSSMGPGSALEVEDFEEAMAGLKKAGTKFLYEPFDSPVCHTAIVCDPDGNVVAIHKRKPNKAT